MCNSVGIAVTKKDNKEQEQYQQKIEELQETKKELHAARERIQALEMKLIESHREIATMEKDRAMIWREQEAEIDGLKQLLERANEFKLKYENAVELEDLTVRLKRDEKTLPVFRTMLSELLAAPAFPEFCELVQKNL